MPTPTIGQTWGSPPFVAGTTQTVTSAGAVANGSTVDVTVITKKASGSANISVGDLQNNNYTLIKSVNDNTVGSTCRRYVAQNVVGGIIAIEVDCTTSVEMSIYAVEIKPPPNGALTLDSSYSNTATSATSIEVDVQDTNQLGNGVLVLGSATQKSGTGIAITSGLASLYENDGSGTTAGISVAYQNGVNLATGATFPVTWTFASSANLVAVAITYGWFFATSTTPKGPTATAIYSARDILLPIGSTTVGLPEHSGGAAATSSGSIFSISKNINYLVPGVTVSAGSGSGILIPYTGPLAAIAICAQLTRGTAGSIAGANDAGGGAHGAWTLSSDANNQLVGQVVTNSNSTTFTGTKGEAMGAAPAIYWIINDGTNLIIESNTFEVARLALSGTPLTVNVASALRILNAYVSGGDATPTSGTFYEARIFSTVPSFANRRIVDSDMAWPLGPALTKRYRTIGFNNTGFADVVVAAESDDAIAWSGVRNISYRPIGATADVRDVTPLWYDSVNAIWYFGHTMFNFSVTGGTSAIMKFRNDWRLGVPHGLIDCTSVINAATNAPWGCTKYPAGVPYTTAPTSVFITVSNSNTAVRVPVTDLVAGTFGTLVTRTGNNKEPAWNLAPNSIGNPTSNFRSYGGPAIGYQDANTIDATYTLTATIDSTASASVDEACYIPPNQYADGNLRLYTGGLNGPFFFTTADNGATWSSSASVTNTTGLHPNSGGVIDMGQCEMVDFKPLGLWSSPAPSQGRLSIGTGIGL